MKSQLVDGEYQLIYCVDNDNNNNRLNSSLNDKIKENLSLESSDKHQTSLVVIHD